MLLGIKVSAKIMLFFSNALLFPKVFSPHVLFSAYHLQIQKKAVSLHRNSENQAQMAESVDALVSNTSGFTSIPVRPRVWVQERKLSI